MTIPPYDKQSLQGWTPVRFFRGDNGQPVVEWCELGDLRLTAPFFMQTVGAARARNLPVRLTPATALTEFAATEPDLPLSGIIFHLTRCGSTLVTQMFAALPANAVFSEPDAVGQILESVRWPEPVDAGQRVDWLRGLVHAWGRRRFADERRLFLKLDPWQLLDLDVIRAAWPGVPWVFLYRDPVEILVSQSDNFAGTIFSTEHGPASIGLTAADLSQMSADEYCARVLGAAADAMAEAAADPSIPLIAYPQLPAATEGLIAPHFGLNLSDADKQRMQQATHFHAKAPGRLVFQEDSARKQRDADGDLRELAARWLGPAYARLEEMRLARNAVAGEIG